MVLPGGSSIYSGVLISLQFVRFGPTFLPSFLPPGRVHGQSVHSVHSVHSGVNLQLQVRPGSASAGGTVHVGFSPTGRPFRLFQVVSGCLLRLGEVAPGVLLRGCIRGCICAAQVHSAKYGTVSICGSHPGFLCLNLA